MTEVKTSPNTRDRRKRKLSKLLTNTKRIRGVMNYCIKQEKTKSFSSRTLFSETCDCGEETKRCIDSLLLVILWDNLTKKNIARTHRPSVTQWGGLCMMVPSWSSRSFRYLLLRLSFKESLDFTNHTSFYSITPRSTDVSMRLHCKHDFWWYLNSVAIFFLFKQRVFFLSL